MSTEPEPIRTPSRKGLMMFGAVAVIAAAGAIYMGIVGRAKSEQELARWTDEQAVPTVTLAKVQRGAKDRELVLPGTIQAYSMAPIYARATGYVKGWNVDIGAHVKAGQVLATLDTPDVDQQWMQAKAELASAVAADKLAAVTAVRWHQMVNAVSRQDVDTKDSDAVAKHAAVDSAQANVARLEALEAFKSLVAPFDGIVTQRNTDVGNLVNAGAGQPMFEVADMHEARIYVRVPQAFLGELKPGIKAILDIPQYPDERFEAKLVSTSNSVTEDSRSALVQLQADNPDDKLWPGSFTEVHFQLAGNPDAIRLPSTALIFADHGMQVAILDADGTAKLKTVQIGRDLGESVEITSGVSASDRVIDNPPETLGSGDPVRMVGADAESAPAKVSSTAPVGKDKVE